MKLFTDPEFWINDGRATHYSLPGCDLDEQCRFADKYLYCQNGARSSHEEHLALLVRRCAKMLSNCHEWVKKFTSDFDIAIRLSFTDGNQFAARCSKDILVGSKTKYYSVEISLATIPVLFGCANRLLTTEGTQDDYISSWYAQSVMKEWQPATDPIGIISFGPDGLEPTFAVVIDALQLIYFHEVAHLLCGHLSFPKISDRSEMDHFAYVRVAEAEADWRSGWLFRAFNQENASVNVLRGQRHENQPLLRRLSYACLSNYISLQVLYRPSDDGRRYYLPPTRMQIFLAGAENLMPNIGQGEGWAHKLIYSLRDLPSLEYLFSHRFPDWVDAYSSQAAKDMVESGVEREQFFDELRKETKRERLVGW